MITGRGSAVDLASGRKGAFYNMLEEFHEYWERIDIITPKVKKPVSNIFGNTFIHPSPWPLLLHPVFFIKKALEIYNQQKFNLITVQEFPPFYNGIAARLLWNKVRVPYILEIHHITGYPKAGGLKEKIYKWLSYIFLKYDSSKAKAVRVVNQKQVPEFLIKAGVPKGKIVYLPSLYIDLEVFKPLNLPKKYDLIFIGRLVKNKGINLFLEAVKELNCGAVIVGDGPLKESVKFKIKSLKLKIDLIGWAENQTEVARLLNMSKILVMPSYNEGGPRVVGEAMACGVPVLATPVGIVQDIIKDGESGGIISWNPEEIAEKAKTLLENKLEYERYKQIGGEIARQFEKNLTIKNYALKIQNLTS